MANYNQQEDQWGHYGNQGDNRNQNQRRQRNHDQVGYSGDSAFPRSLQDEGDYRQASGNRNDESGRSDYGMDFNPGGYGPYKGDDSFRQGRSGNYGQASYGNRSGNEGGQGRNYGEGMSGGNYGQQHIGAYSSDYGRRDFDRRNAGMDMGYGSSGTMGLGNESYRGGRSGYGNESSNERRTGGYRGKGPRDYQRSQDRIREDICDRLTDDDHLDASEIRVQFEGDAVVLSGTVHDREQKRRAEDVVESVSGVRHVENRIRVSDRDRDRNRDANTMRDYTGNSDNTGGIGDASGTTNEIIRDANRKNKL